MPHHPHTALSLAFVLHTWPCREPCGCVLILNFPSQQQVCSFLSDRASVMMRTMVWCSSDQCLQCVEHPAVYYSCQQEEEDQGHSRPFGMSRWGLMVFPGRKDRWHHGQPSMPQGDPQDVWYPEQQCQHDLLPSEHACWVLLLLQPQSLSGQRCFPEKVRVRPVALSCTSHLL